MCVCQNYHLNNKRLQRCSSQTGRNQQNLQVWLETHKFAMIKYQVLNTIECLRCKHTNLLACCKLGSILHCVFLAGPMISKIWNLFLIRL